VDSRIAAIEKIRTNFSSLQDVWIFVQVFFLVTLLPLLMKILSLPRLMEMMTPNHVNNAINEMQDRIVKYADYILSRNFWIYRTTCLKRSLVLYHFLRKYGINVQLCFGVRYNNKLTDSEAKELLGHAWLIYDGDMYLEQNVDAARTYKATYCFPSES